jgi:hypothetical protein
LAQATIKTYPYTLLCILFAALQFAHSTENINVVQVTPAWNIFNNNPTKNDRSQLPFNYKTNLQGHIIDILSSMDIRAIPALYTSAFQTSYDPRNFEELNRLLKYEPNEQIKYLTLVPIIKTSSIEVKRKRYKIWLSISIRVMDSNGQLGEELFEKEAECRGAYETIPPGNSDLEGQQTAIKDNLSSEKKQWNAIKAYIAEHAKGYRQFPKFDKSRFFKEQSTHYFAQSDGMFYNNKPQAVNGLPLRFFKSNILIITPNENNDKLLFAFDLADEIPSVLYAYSITPDFKVNQVRENDIHIEKSPEAVPNDTYNSMRYLVINLPGITAGSVVCYAVKYYDRGCYDSTYFYYYKSTGYGGPLARDFMMNYSNDSTPWQLRIWVPNTTKNLKLYAQGNNVSISDSNSFGFCETFQLTALTQTLAQNKYKKTPSYSLLGSGSRTISDKYSSMTGNIGDGAQQYYSFYMFLYQGLPTPVPIPALEPLTYIEPPIVRVSTVLTWDSLYSDSRDSIFSILGRRHANTQPISHYPKPGKALDSAVFHLQKFMSDSLRYIHISFNAHKTIPVCPDSILKTKMGDCKDYSTLFISELKSIGLEAFPALVNSSWPFSLSMPLPSCDAFNHMIVYVPKHNWWIDPLYFPIPPEVTPEYLTGLKSLVLFKDSVRIMSIKDNDDSMYNSTIKYEIEISGQNIKCKYIELSACEKSCFIRKYLAQIDSSRYLDMLFPKEKYNKKYSTNEHGVVFSGLEESMDRLSFTRKFEVDNAITTAGNSKLLNLPEIPLFWYVSMVSANNRVSDLYLPANLICDVAIKIVNGYKVRWPKSVTSEAHGSMLRIVKMSNDEIIFRFHVKKGLMPLKEYRLFKSALDGYRNFFSNPIPIQKSAR